MVTAAWPADAIINQNGVKHFFNSDSRRVWHPALLVLGRKTHLKSRGWRHCETPKPRAVAVIMTGSGLGV